MKLNTARLVILLNAELRQLEREEEGYNFIYPEKNLTLLKNRLDSIYEIINALEELENA